MKIFYHLVWNHNAHGMISNVYSSSDTITILVRPSDAPIEDEEED